MSGYDGILNVAKPAGWTSHDVVAKLRHVLGTRKIGHAGTLDPLATGVLLVCVGKSTRLTQYLMAGIKEYRVGARLGVVTDTYDADGSTVSECPVPEFTWDDLNSTLQGFSGEIWQVPPAFSAIKSGGVPAYRRARRGEKVSLPARQVMIHELRLVSWHRPDVEIEVRCDPGTYVRSLIHDLGERLACGAVVTSLARTRSGCFDLAQAVSIEEIAAAVTIGDADRLFHSPLKALSTLTMVGVDAESQHHLTQGQPIPAVGQPETGEGYAVNAKDELVAILRYNALDALWWPAKVFAGQSPD